MKPYDHRLIEPAWQKKWADEKLYTTHTTSTKPKYYILDMFPYPSGEGLHVGHPKGYIATDIMSRMKRMQGYNVLHPMGFDAFGLPAENYALKTKTHPSEAVAKNVARYKKQLEILGFDYDQEREINTTDPAYYRWTQWIFLKLYEKGLAYESFEPINWCPSCKTGLANEDVEDGRCERCGTPVEKKPLRQWVLRITKYADRLLNDLEALDWPASIKESQKHWIGRSEGVTLTFKVKDTPLELSMYDSIPQTYMAQTFTIIAPDHPRLDEILQGLPAEKIAEVQAFAEKIKAQRLAGGYTHDINKDAEGIFTGRFIEYTPTGKLLPLWVASYAVADYGTGVVNCSAHDERDFAFATKYNIPLHGVLVPPGADADTVERIKQGKEFYRQPEGVLLEPAVFTGRRWDEVRADVIQHIIEQGWGKRTVNYRLRDWVFSRQRYWGEPIPMLHTPQGVQPMAEADLPLTLPVVASYEPTGTGESPLAAITEWVNTPAGKRETNTMPQWAGSSWYYLRFMDPHNTQALVSPEAEKYWGQVDMYVGGAEHATRHLIYARFWHKFLYDIGVVHTSEPFQRLQHVGLIVGEDGRKMSKRFGNVVNPDDVIATYGADTMRLYEMFLGPFDQSIAWSTDGIIGCRRFIERVWRMVDKVQGVEVGTEVHNELQTLVHRTIKKVSEDIAAIRHNTAVSSLMILATALDKALDTQPVDANIRLYIETLLCLLAPFAPHVTEELWYALGHTSSIHTSTWPSYDATKIIEEKATLAVQVNGRTRATITVARDESEEGIRAAALAHTDIQRWLQGKTPTKVIVVPGKIVSIVVG
jgi:leucyl-tRNA synthetase